MAVEYNTMDGRWHHFGLFNANLDLVKSDSVFIQNRVIEKQTSSSKENLYCFFKDRKGNFTLLCISSDNLSITKTEGKLPQNLLVSEMAVLGDFAYFKSEIKRTAYLFSINIKNGKHQPIPINVKNVKSKHISLVGFQLLEDTEEILLYASVRIDKKNSDTYIICLDRFGKKTNVYNLSVDLNKNLVGVSSCNLGNGNYIFTGTYSLRSYLGSEGIFFCKSNLGEIEYIRFYPFSNFQNILSYLPKKTQARIEKRKKKKEDAGNEYTLRYEISAHDIILRNDGYLLLGEAYYASYRTEIKTTTTTINNVTTTTTTSEHVFDGYQYTHAILAKFDFHGELMWDQTFEMWPQYKPYNVKRFIAVSDLADYSIKMVFTNKSGIVSKIVDNNGIVTQDKQYEKIETFFENDKPKYTFSEVDYWFDNYFIAHGFQKIKNPDNNIANKTRNVFFVSKFRLD